MMKSKDSLLPSVLRIMIIFTVAVVLVMIVLFFLMRFAIRGDEVEVPDLVGKSFVEASEICNQSHLPAPKIEGRKYSGDFPENYVVEQKPAPGRKVKSGRAIKVFLSKGTEAGIVPRVVDLTVTEARNVLKSLGLEVGTITKVHSDDFPKEGVIIAHTPSANATVQKGIKVNLLVSMGAPYVEIIMPDLRGMKLKNASELLKYNGLQMGQIDREYTPEVADANIVLEQSPQPNERVRRGASVNVIVSSLEGEVDFESYPVRRDSQSTNSP